MLRKCSCWNYFDFNAGKFLSSRFRYYSLNIPILVDFQVCLAELYHEQGILRVSWETSVIKIQDYIVRSESFESWGPGSPSPRYFSSHFNLNFHCCRKRVKDSFFDSSNNANLFPSNSFGNFFFSYLKLNFTNFHRVLNSQKFWQDWALVVMSPAALAWGTLPITNSLTRLFNCWYGWKPPFQQQLNCPRSLKVTVQVQVKKITKNFFNWCKILGFVSRNCFHKGWDWSISLVNFELWPLLGKFFFRSPIRILTKLMLYLKL